MVRWQGSLRTGTANANTNFENPKLSHSDSGRIMIMMAYIIMNGRMCVDIIRPKLDQYLCSQELLLRLTALPSS